MSQQTLAGELGITFQQIQKYENGVNRISARVLWRLVQILDTDYSALLPQMAKPANVAPGKSADFVALGDYYLRLNALGRRALLATARTFAADPDMIDKRPKG